MVGISRAGGVSLSSSFPPARTSSLTLKDFALVKAVSCFEGAGFMEWHARVLRILRPTPLPIKEIARRTGLFQYHVRSVVQDLVGLGLVEYTRYGINILEEWDLLHSLAACCESKGLRKTWDFEAAFEVSVPRVVALERRFRN